MNLMRNLMRDSNTWCGIFARIISFRFTCRKIACTWTCSFGLSIDQPQLQGPSTWPIMYGPAQLSSGLILAVVNEWPLMALNSTRLGHTCKRAIFLHMNQKLKMRLKITCVWLHTCKSSPASLVFRFTCGKIKAHLKLRSAQHELDLTWLCSKWTRPS